MCRCFSKAVSKYNPHSQSSLVVLLLHGFGYVATRHRCVSAWQPRSQPTDSGVFKWWCLVERSHVWDLQSDAVMNGTWYKLRLFCLTTSTQLFSMNSFPLNEKKNNYVCCCNSDSKSFKSKTTVFTELFGSSIWAWSKVVELPLFSDHLLSPLWGKGVGGFNCCVLPFGRLQVLHTGPHFLTLLK